MPIKPDQSGKRKGSALVTAVVLTGVLSLTMASLLSYALTERRLTGRHQLRLQAKNSAESIVEYGFAQLRHKFENRTNLGANALEPGSADELILPALDALPTNVVPGTLQIIGGTIPPFPNNLTYINPADPNNAFDPLKGKFVRAREISVYGKAELSAPNGGPPITSYVTQKLQVRDAPLFAHAIFYNLDLEISPGPKMDIYGPVHTNGNLYVQGISGVDFHSQVTTSEHMYYGWGTTNSSAQGAGNENLQGGHVKFVDRNNNLVSMLHDGFYHDTKMGTGTDSPNWRSYASNRWHGNMQTSAHGIEEYQPVAFPEYSPDKPDTAAYDPINTGHALIEPTLPIGHPNYKEEVEKQKMSKKAGLIFKFNTQTETVKLYKNDGTQVDTGDELGGGELWEYNNNKMLDRRRGIKVDMVDIDMGKLKKLIEDPSDTDSPDIKDRISGYDPATDWNGIVYFETYSPSGDPHLGETGVRLYNGRTNATDQGIPSRGLDPGMTFATNNALYIKGHFNADGTRHQDGNANHSAVVPEAGEVPVALFADSITILSTDWDDAFNLQPGKATTKPTANHTEVAAAIVSGLIPSNAAGNGDSSGGVHNFPRFLENWGGKDLFIRGAMVCLYESETDPSTWAISYYSPPYRKWGFNRLFRDGTYPPGTPLIRTYRRVDYTDMSQADYDVAVAALPW